MRPCAAEQALLDRAAAAAAGPAARCPRCRAQADASDSYCRRCGRCLRPRMGFWYDHAGVLLLTLIAGPFSLITIWLSRKLSPCAKIGWSLAVGLLCLYFAYSAYRSYLLFKEVFAASFSVGF